MVLCIQTTALDLNGQAVEGLGPRSSEAQRGLYGHPTYAVRLARAPWGVLDAWRWAREPKDEKGERGGVRESLHGSKGYDRLAELAVEWPDTRLLFIADREADSVEWMAKARDLGTPVDWLRRSQHNRVLPEGGKPWKRVRAGAVWGEGCFTLPARQGQQARVGRQQVWAAPVELADGRGGRVRARGILAKERDAPAGITPIEWRRLTNREVLTFKAACEMIDGYRARWEIKLFSRLKKRLQG